MDIYVIVVYSLNDKREPVEMHNHGWFSKLEDAKKYMSLAGQPVDGGFYEDPFEMRWDYVMIEKVPEGVSACGVEVVAHYQAEWYKDPDYKRDDTKIDLVNAMEQTKFRVKELSEAPFDISGLFGFAGF